MQKSHSTCRIHGLTWDHLKDVIRAEIGAGNFAAIERVFQLIGNYDTPAAGVTAMYDFITALPARLGSEFSSLFTNFNWNNLVDRLVTAAKDQLTSSLVEILPRLAAKFIPGVGVLTSIYDGISFLIDNAANLGAIFTSFVNSVGELAASVAQPSRLANFTRAIVTIVSNQGVDLILNFAASQLGLGNLRQTVRNVVNFIPTQVDALMRRAVSAIAASITAALPGGGSTGLYAGMIGSVRTFTYRSHNYTLWVARPRTGNPQVKIAEGTRLIAALTPAMFNESIRPGSRGRLAAIVTAARNVAGAANVAAANQLLPALTAAETNLIPDILANACSALNAGCFAAGTKLWTPDGYRTIESILPGELVFTRDEFDPYAEIVARPVEEGFRRFAPLLHLHIGGQVIRTTGEHPFFVYNKGWTKAAALQQWDCVLTDDGQWVAVEEVYDTGEWEVVYNLRVAEHHTYFVGDWNWDWSVWSHNTGGACGIDIALGRREFLPTFRSQVAPDAIIYTEWVQRNFVSSTISFVSAFAEAVSKARYVYFNIEGISDIHQAVIDGRRGPTLAFNNGASTRESNYTNYELFVLSVKSEFGDSTSHETAAQFKAKIRWYNSATIASEPNNFAELWRT